VNHPQGLISVKKTVVPDDLGFCFDEEDENNS